MELLSIIGSTLLAICSVPELIRTIRNKKCGIGWGIILTWVAGEIWVFTHLMHKQEYILCINYSLNMIIVSIMTYYKLKYKEEWYE